jgi:exopolyphosphatase/guanosine-5'-triphosphate,3'-diphosphate pyrophosphatase
MLGIRSGLPADIAGILALDIGGGSTECILDRPDHLPVVRSMDIGVVRLGERVLKSDPPAAGELQQARHWIRNETEAAVATMPLTPGLTCIGTAGTITALAAMDQQLSVYDATKIHNYILKLDAVKRLEAQLLGRSKQQREGLPGLERGREDVIVAGAIILSTMMETLGMETVLVSDLGLREGVLLHLANRLN